MTKKLQLVIAVDFDGTCVDHRFPGVGPDAPEAVRVMKRLIAAECKLILFTMRSDGSRGNYLGQAERWFMDREIDLWGVQANPNQHNWTSSPKAYAQVYIDDAALGCPMIRPEGFERSCVDWLAVEKLLFQDEAIEETAEERLGRQG